MTSHPALKDEGHSAVADESVELSAKRGREHDGSCGERRKEALAEVEVREGRAEVR